MKGPSHGKISRNLRETPARIFLGSLYEFYGLRLIAEWRGWNAAQIMDLLPRLICPTPWWQYEKFIQPSA